MPEQDIRDRMQEPLRILLVDDSPFDRGMVRRELRNEFPNIKILEVLNADEFAAALNAAEFDLVITDFQIRWTDGLKVFRDVKERQPDCPVLMFTATGSEEIAVQAMKSGLDDYIIKNVKHMVRLRGAVHSALAHGRTRLRADKLATQLESLLGHLRVGVFRRTVDGRIIEVNAAMAAILGHSRPDELIGKNLDDYLNNGNRVIHAAAKSRPGDEDFESMATRKDGRSIWISVNEREVAGSYVEKLFEGLMEDITDRKKAEEEVMRLQDEMAHVSRVNTMVEMSAGISHELNQPLSAIANYAQACVLMLKNSPSAPGVVENLGQISELAQQAGQVIRGLREFTQTRPREPKRVPLGFLIHNTLEMLSFEIRNSRIVVQLDICEPDVTLTMDPVQIRQVLLNLFSNAIDAMSSNSPDERILSVSLRSDDSKVDVCVGDRGAGIPAGDESRIFEPYFTTKHNGTGIGLAISSRIIKAHRGKLSGFNNEDAGATLTFTLPLDS